MNYLHSDDSVDEEQHNDEQCDVRQSLKAEQTQTITNLTLTLQGSHVSDDVTWKDLMNVQRSVRMPSPRLSSLTRRMTRKRRKKLMLIIDEPEGCNENT